MELIGEDTEMVIVFVNGSGYTCRSSEKLFGMGSCTDVPLSHAPRSNCHISLPCVAARSMRVLRLKLSCATAECGNPVPSGSHDVPRSRDAYTPMSVPAMRMESFLSSITMVFA